MTYYEVSLKRSPSGSLDDHTNFALSKMDIADRPAMEQLFANENLIALSIRPQTGVRHSPKNPAYVDKVIRGFE